MMNLVQKFKKKFKINKVYDKYKQFYQVKHCYFLTIKILKLFALKPIKLNYLYEQEIKLINSHFFKPITFVNYFKSFKEFLIKANWTYFSYYFFYTIHYLSFYYASTKTIFNYDNLVDKSYDRCKYFNKFIKSLIKNKTLDNSKIIKVLELVN